MKLFFISEMDRISEDEPPKYLVGIEYHISIKYNLSIILFQIPIFFLDCSRRKDRLNLIIITMFITILLLFIAIGETWMDSSLHKSEDILKNGKKF